MSKDIESTKLKIISDVSHAIIVHKENINSLLQVILDVLQEDMGLERAAFTVIEAFKGVTEKEHSRGQYHLGEGLTGKTIVIADITKDVSFLNRIKVKYFDKSSFICVPIIYEEEVIGTLSIDCPPSLNLNLLHTQQLLEIIGNLLADGVVLLRNELEKKSTLCAENLRLKNELENYFKLKNIIGNCNSMKAVYGMIGQVASSLYTILIRGDSSTGKELIAKAIHMPSLTERKTDIILLPDYFLEKYNRLYFKQI